MGFIVFVSVFTYLYFAKDLTSKEKIMNSNNTGLVLVDRNNKPFFTFYSAKVGNYVPLSAVSKEAQQAIVVEEDKNFYSEGGFSIPAIIGAALADIKQGQPAYGGSTITQQLVKNSLLNSNKSLLRKYQEMVLSQEISRRYSKDETLEMYLNSVYFGNGAFGIEQAAKYYFGVDAKDLDLAQSSILAALLPAPTELSPVGGNTERAKLRQKFVLDKMRDSKVITEGEERGALAEKLNFTNGVNDMNSQAPHFALMIRDELIQKYGEEKVIRDGFQVKTTIDLDKQAFAQQAVREGVKRLAGDNVSNGSAVVMNPKTGEVLAMVGSEDWSNDKFGKVNMATTPRQTGSAFKPVVYSAALEERLITPATILQDVPTTFNNCLGATPEQLKDPNCRYAPKDFDLKFWGPVTVRRSLANSRNVSSVQVMQKVGVGGALEIASRLGISTLGDDPTQYGLSLVLGTGQVKLVELTGAYSVFANQGVRNAPADILQIEDKYGNTLYSYSPSPQEVLAPGVAYLISSILSDDKTRQEEFGNALTINKLAAVKTGTTEDFKDSWTVGYTPSLAIGVWVGNNDNQAMDNIAGSLGAAPIWRVLMEHYLAGLPSEQFSMPSDVVRGNSCSIVVTADSKDPSKKNTQIISGGEYFLAGTEPIHGCNPTASSSAVLSQNINPSEFPTSSPTSSDQTQGECIGPDGKHLNLGPGDCQAFNRAWKK